MHRGPRSFQGAGASCFLLARDRSGRDRSRSAGKIPRSSLRTGAVGIAAPRRMRFVGAQPHRRSSQSLRRATGTARRGRVASADGARRGTPDAGPGRRRSPSPRWEFVNEKRRIHPGVSVPAPPEICTREGCLDGPGACPLARSAPSPRRDSEIMGSRDLSKGRSGRSFDVGPPSAWRRRVRRPTRVRGATPGHARFHTVSV